MDLALRRLEMRPRVIASILRATLADLSLRTNAVHVRNAFVDERRKSMEPTRFICLPRPATSSRYRDAPFHVLKPLARFDLSMRTTARFFTSISCSHFLLYNNHVFQPRREAARDIRSVIRSIRELPPRNISIAWSVATNHRFQKSKASPMDPLRHFDIILTHCRC